MTVVQDHIFQWEGRTVVESRVERLDLSWKAKSEPGISRKGEGQGVDKLELHGRDFREILLPRHDDAQRTGCVGINAMHRCQRATELRCLHTCWRPIVLPPGQMTKGSTCLRVSEIGKNMHSVCHVACSTRNVLQYL